MAWTNLPTDYEDAVWSGLKKYAQVNNEDGTVSFKDMTVYTKKEKSFFGAADANAMNAAMNQLAGNMDTISQKATQATNAASTATTKASEAATSAQNAENAKIAAASSASSASSSATTASQKATAAANSATAASGSATSAANSAQAAQASATELAALLFNNAGAHNAIYRGKNLGTSVTAAQWAAIANGSFTDLYIGDYWVIGGFNWRIAAFDYYYKSGDTSCTTHHVVIVPDTNLYTHCMNDTNITTGGYIGSKMYTEGLAQAKTTINNAFGSSHILSHRQFLVNAVTNGKPSGGSWYDSTVELMTEQNVYGGKIFGAGNDGSTIPYLHTIDKSQFPLFAHDPSMISNRQWFWLRDVVSAATFAYVYGIGYAGCGDASSAGGVRPAFSIKS